jgi:uncharacterized protein (TIGR03086 family)
VTSPLTRYLRALDGFTDVVEHVPTEVWDAPPPDPGWSARQLLGHVIDGQAQVVGMLIGHPRPPVADDAALARLAGPHPVQSWRTCRADVTAVLTGVDAAATVTTPGGPSTAAAVLAMAVIEPLVHAWDLATAVGRPVHLDPDVVDALLPGVLAAGDRLAATGMYRPAVPVAADAPAQERLLGALGRRV